MKLKLFWFLLLQCPQPSLSLLERERAKERKVSGAQLQGKKTQESRIFWQKCS
ncbi:hypothetical protein GLYMA_04G156650v4 [Glycine max]|nr:hypothetical protein GLYMA_04G156650v4 [Glycine max]KAH1111531.1 hypothetical protein GYH30_010075 [Glycine max]